MREGKRKKTLTMRFVIWRAACSLWVPIRPHGYPSQRAAVQGSQITAVTRVQNELHKAAALHTKVGPARHAKALCLEQQHEWMELIYYWIIRNQKQTWVRMWIKASLCMVFKRKINDLAEICWHELVNFYMIWLEYLQGAHIWINWRIIQ